MKILWSDSGTRYSARLDAPVKVKLKTFSGNYYTRYIDDIGYVLKRDDKWLAQTYGSINKDWPGQFFTDLDAAKAEVETQALIGITLNRLTR